MTTIFPASRDAALAVLHGFLDSIPAYAARRNFVTVHNREVSRLSPYLRRRLLTEEAVVTAALERHPFQIAEKFVQEVVWRTYWKGWLERNPSVWLTCVESEANLLRGQVSAPWGELYHQASRGETRLSFFNEWIHELIDTGYLHNHVRMWFASVWVFTFKLPWQLGAMFMYRNLLDGDPASNTLSWRWVVGLQTRGKSYLARPDNISKFSEGRWSPNPGDLAEAVFPVELDVAVGLGSDPEVTSDELPTADYGVLTTGDDLSVELDGRLMSRARSLALLQFRSEHGESKLVEAFAMGSDEDALVRFGARARRVDHLVDILDWSTEQQLSHVVIVQPPVGPNTERTRDLTQALTAHGVECCLYRREWDRQMYQLADKGFFPFWERVKKRIQTGVLLRAP